MAHKLCIRFKVIYISHQKIQKKKKKKTYLIIYAVPEEIRLVITRVLYVCIFSLVGSSGLDSTICFFVNSFHTMNAGPRAGKARATLT